jgi:acyl-CoA synthetase (AMP-forming)/AMP-acid ligase II
VKIVDARSHPLPDGAIGEIQVRSDCMLTGYFERPDLTAEAVLDGWYRTGDLGCVIDGDLYVTGRIKDLIIVGGKNIHPQDLEAEANEVPGLRPGRAVAFGVDDPGLGSEKIVMVCELAAPEDPAARAAIEAALRKRILQYDVTLADVRLVDDRWLIKTSSGKIARADNRAKYLRERAG